MKRPHLIVHTVASADGRVSLGPNRTAFDDVGDERWQATWCVFQPKPITDSRPSRSPIPRQGDQRFRSKPITDSMASRSLLTGAVESLRGSF